MTPVPPVLLDLQTWVARLLVRPLHKSDALNIPVYDAKTNEEIAQKITPGPGLSAQQRIGLYNQQYWFRLLSLMQEDYPMLARLFGYTEFNTLIAEPYLLKYVPDHWCLAFLGSRLPQWIEAFYEDEDKHLVLASAQIDEAYQRIFYAPKLPSLSPEDLRTIEERTLYLQPFIGLFSFRADLFAFRKALLLHDPDHWMEEELPLITWSYPRYFVLSGYLGAFRVEEVASAEFFLLKAFEQGAKLEEALSSLPEESDPSHVGDWFCKWSRKQWLTISHPDF